MQPGERSQPDRKIRGAPLFCPTCLPVRSRVFSIAYSNNTSRTHEERTIIWRLIGLKRRKEVKLRMGLWFLTSYRIASYRSRTCRRLRSPRGRFVYVNVSLSRERERERERSGTAEEGEPRENPQA